MSDTDHKRPNRREILAELAQVKRALDAAEKRVEEAEHERDRALADCRKANARADAVIVSAAEALALVRSETGDVHDTDGMLKALTGRDH